jgi:hypothetical protein
MYSTVLEYGAATMAAPSWQPMTGVANAILIYEEALQNYIA